MTLALLSTVLSDVVSFFQASIWPRFLHIVLAWYDHPDMLWTIIPLLAATTLMVLYFGRYKTEKLGWNTAFGNTISLFFVIASLAQGLILKYTPSDFFDPAAAYLIVFDQPLYQLIFLSILGLEAVLLMNVNYYHRLPEWLSFYISSTIPMNGLSLLAILVIKGDVPLDRITIYTAIFFFFVFWASFTLLKWYVKPSRAAKAVITRKNNIARAARKRKIEEFQAAAAQNGTVLDSKAKRFWKGIWGE